MQAVAPSTAVNWPIRQASHPASTPYEPGRHSEQADRPRWELQSPTGTKPKPLRLPSLRRIQPCTPCRAKFVRKRVPAGQGKQRETPSSVVCCPSTHDEHAVAPARDVEPAAHGEHADSSPTTPTSQNRQAAHEVQLKWETDAVKMGVSEGLW